MGILPSEEACNKEAAKSLYKAVLLGLCLPSGQLSGFIPPSWPTLGHCPGCAHTPLPRGVSEWRLLEEQPHYGLELSSDFWLQGAFLHLCSITLIFYSEGFFLLSLALFPWGVHKRQWLVIYPVSVVTSISKSKWGAGCKFPSWSPPISCLRKCKEEADWL